MKKYLLNQIEEIHAQIQNCPVVDATTIKLLNILERLNGCVKTLAQQLPDKE